jgi:hypothetical protein
MVPSHPTRVKFLFCLDPARWRAGPLAPQSHFAVLTILLGGMTGLSEHLPSFVICRFPQSRSGRGEVVRLAQKQGAGGISEASGAQCCLWPLPWTRRWEGVGTNPECAVQSTDKFPTPPSRIQVEIRDLGKVPGLKSGCGGRAPSAAPGRGCPRRRRENTQKRGEVRGRDPGGCGRGQKESEQTRNVPSNQ